MEFRKKALRFCAWFALAYVCLGVTCLVLSADSLFKGNQGRWSAKPLLIRVEDSPLWLLAGTLLNIVGMIAFFRQAGGSPVRLLFRTYACSLVLLCLSKIALTIALIKTSPISMVTSSVTSTTWHFTSEDLILSCIVALIFGLPLFVRLSVSLLTRPNVTDGSDYCSDCGYNLTGNTSGQCPECGLQIEDPDEDNP